MSLAAPPPSTVVEEERETKLPALPGGGLHGSPSWSELKALGGDAAEIESEGPVVAHATKVVEIPFDDETDDVVELLAPSWELAVVWSMARPSSRLEEGDLEWPCPEDPSKVRFILWDSQECQLWDILGGKGLATMSELANMFVKLEDTQERVKSAQQLVKVNLQLTVEVSLLCLSLIS